jgi:hypothetical protein
MAVKITDKREMIGVVVDADMKERLTAASKKAGMKLSPYCEAILKDHIEARRNVVMSTTVTG